MITKSARNCSHPHAERAHRQGILDVLIGILGYRPFRCIVCDMRWYKRVDNTDWSGLSSVIIAVLCVIVLLIVPDLIY